MKKLVNIIFIVGILFFGNACHDSFLKETVYSSLNPDVFFSTGADLEAGVIGCYSAMQSTGYYGKAMIYMVDGSCEWIKGYFNEPTDVYTVSSGLQSDPNQRDVSDFWQQSWVVNNQCNMVINRADVIHMDEDYRNRLVGEARFLRALNRFNQIRLFGSNIPLISSETNSLNDLNVSLSSFTDIYNAIIADLEIAEIHLPNTTTKENKGRATSWSAIALLGKVYLTMAGYAEDPNTGIMVKGDASNLIKAKTYLEKVINCGLFSLVQNPTSLFLNSNEDNSEILFAIKYQEGGLGEGNAFTPRFCGKGNAWIAYSFKTWTATWEFYNSYSSVDLRKSAWFWTKIPNAKGIMGTVDFPKVNKYVSDIDLTLTKKFAVTNSGDYGDDVIVLRYADVLLMYSEVLNEINGPSDIALLGLNQVRLRAGLSPYTISGISNISVINRETPSSIKDKIRELIIQERKWELNTEMNGKFDYVRWNILMREMNKYYEWGIFDPVANSKYNLFPIYIVDLELNSKLKQNWGW